MQRSAVLSECGRYRYRLERRWAPGPKLTWVMLNPSTADASVDDPTVRRCVSFSRNLGYGGLVIVNLFAFRATDPAALHAAEDPIGPDNDFRIVVAAALVDQPTDVICAWGAHGGLHDRDRHVLALLRRHGIMPQALRLTRALQPAHPLYLPSKLQPFSYGGRP